MVIVNGVKSHREELGLTQIEYAKRAGVSRRTVQRWEKGGQTARRSYVREAAERLGVVVERLLSMPIVAEVIEPAARQVGLLDFMKGLAQLWALLEHAAVAFAEELARWRQHYAGERALA